MDIKGDWYSGNSYKTKLTLHEPEWENHIKEIENKIIQMRSLPYEFVVVELYKENGEADIPAFFQTTRNRDYNPTISKRYTYCVEIGVRETGGNRLYIKNDVDCAKALRLFREICVERKMVNLEDWERDDYLYSLNLTADEIEEKKRIKRYRKILSMYYNGEIDGELGNTAAIETIEELRELDWIFQDVPTLISLYRHYDLYDNIKSFFERHSFNCNLANAMGDIAYYGKLGKPDAKTAYDYYEHAGKIGSLRAQYNAAKIYRDGLTHPTDLMKYKQAVKSVYDFYIENDAKHKLPAITDIILELSRIEEQLGNKEKALEYCLEAKAYEQRAMNDVCYSGEKAEKIVLQLYRLTEFDASNMELLDLCYGLQKPCVISLALQCGTILLEAVEYEDEVIVKCENKYYRNAVEFFKNFRYKGKRITAYQNQIDYILMEEAK